MIIICNKVWLSNQKHAIKILLHLQILLIILDTLWFIIGCSIWSSLEQANFIEKQKSSLRSFAKLLCLLELLNKFLLGFILYTEYTAKYSVSDLFAFDYFHQLEGGKAEG